jgi:hypothetical protein
MKVSFDLAEADTNEVAAHVMHGVAAERFRGAARKPCGVARLVEQRVP